MSQSRPQRHETSITDKIDSCNLLYASKLKESILFHLQFHNAIAPKPVTIERKHHGQALTAESTRALLQEQIAAKQAKVDAKAETQERAQAKKNKLKLRPKLTRMLHSFKTRNVGAQQTLRVYQMICQ